MIKKIGLHRLFMVMAVLGMIFASQAPAAQADAITADVVVTLGEDLTAAQRTEILKRLDVPEDVATVSVSNAEEHAYLGNYISAKQIGTRALSSAKMTIEPKGTGVQVTSDNITWVTDEMYANALITAGVVDAKIHVTAPFRVSGTAALTGLMKAYESAADKVIPEEQKTVATEEMIRTAELSDTIGAAQANELMSQLKEALADGRIANEEDLQQLVKELEVKLNVTITDEEMKKLESLFMKMKDLNIDWSQLQDQLDKARQYWNDLIDIDMEEAKSWFDNVIAFLKDVFDAIVDFFRSLFS
ncbi:DUF1002 domain-containing protein [Shouchella lonarensis]|uniref:Uncharacterized protein YpuA, DUF1002 family n=1 Tax=Shouchella lonarensis TaxID=1464122 RepID=A0A1G6KNS2_9BACI|nr:DUF1002 domain-containing protein [Shouchella lonarensis]SDC32471.1 Uncharacterized protein YpuA, DUF1002 family [Shouchella lonarensis]